MKRFAFDPRTIINRDDNIGRLILMIVLIIVVMTWLSPNKFLNLYNFESLSFLFPELGILAIAILVAMLTGGIDLSVIGIANLSAIMAGLFFHAAIGMDAIRAGEGGFVTPVGIALALATGMIAGAVNGLLVTRLRITPILATLGTGQIFTGIALVITGGPAIVGFPAAWNLIGNGKLLGLAAPLIVFLVAAFAIAFLIDRTSFGVSLQLIGTNPKAALFAGINRTRLIFWSFVLSGGLAALAGVLSVSTNQRCQIRLRYILSPAIDLDCGARRDQSIRRSRHGDGSIARRDRAHVAFQRVANFEILEPSDRLRLGRVSRFGCGRERMERTRAVNCSEPDDPLMRRSLVDLKPLSQL